MSAELNGSVTLKGTSEELLAMLKVLRSWSEKYRYKERGDTYIYSEVKGVSASCYPEEMTNEEMKKFLSDSGEELDVSLSVGGGFCPPFDIALFDELAAIAPTAYFEGYLTGFDPGADMGSRFELKNEKLYTEDYYFEGDAYKDIWVEDFENKLSYSKFCKLFKIDKEEFVQDDFYDFITEIAEEGFPSGIDYDEFVDFCEYAEINEDEYKIAIEEIVKLGIVDYEDFQYQISPFDYADKGIVDVKYDSELAKRIENYDNEDYDDYSVEKQDEHENIKVEKELGLRERTITEWKKIFNFKKENDSIIITGYKGEDVIVEIPDKIGKNPVIAIGEHAFSPNANRIDFDTKEKRRKMTSVIIPDPVTKIGNGAFEGCKSLEKIIIPDYVTEIGEKAFSYCKSLKEITIPDSVTEIGEDAFRGCESLEKIIIPDSVTEIGEYAFRGCENLADENGFVIVRDVLYGYYGNAKKVIIPDSVKKIGGSAFWFCSSLEKITIPDSVTEIGDNAFSHCESLKEITIPDSVTEIGEFAFNECESLEKITIPDSVTEIGNYAFYECKSLKEITIPDSVTKIGEKAFYECESLEKIIIPDSVTEIGYGAFYECKSLKEITIPDSVTKIGEKAFYECESLTNITIPDSVTEIGYSAFYECKSLKEITIPDSVQEIGRSAFSHCESLKEITIPDSVTKIGVSAFSGCKKVVIKAPENSYAHKYAKENDIKFEAV